LLGINFAFAKAIHARGCAVLIGDIGLHREAAEWLQSLEKGSGPKVLFQKTDVTIWDQLEYLFDVYTKEFGAGAPDIVVAGAGIYEATSTGFWDDRDQGSHYKLLDINLVHPIKLTRIAIRRMQQARKPGVILHESSIVALKPSAVLPLYAVSKAGLSHFVRSIAPISEMSGIKIVAVAPG
jgi:3-hydroxybutyrate dehydrogenase